MPDEVVPQQVPPTSVQAPPAQTQQALPLEDAPAPSKYVERLSKLGFENVKDDSEAFDRLAAAYERQKEEFGSQLREAIAELRQQQVQPAEQAAPKQDGWWNPPQVDLGMASRYRNADGSWKEGTPSEVRQQVESLEAYRAKFANSFLDNPKNAIGPLIDEIVKERLQQHSRALTADQQYQQQLQTNSWLWEPDPITSQPTRRLSAEGRHFNELMIEVEDDIEQATGVRPTNKAKTFEMAMKRRAVEKAASKQPLTPEQIQDINAGKKAGLLQQAAPGLNRANALPAGGQPPASNRNLTPGQRLAQEMHKNGSFA